MGELVALRWHDVRWSERVLVVERALSGDVEGTTKGRRIRYVPLGDQALGALDRLSRRANFTSADDYVFANVAGDRLDPSALRRRYVASRNAAGLPPLRFHDLRHTAGTLLTRVLDPVTVRDILGHADLKTTERYLHAVRASRLADVATRAFTPREPARPGGRCAGGSTRRGRAARLRRGTPDPRERRIVAADDRVPIHEGSRAAGRAQMRTALVRGRATARLPPKGSRLPGDRRSRSHSTTAPRSRPAWCARSFAAMSALAKTRR